MGWDINSGKTGDGQEEKLAVLGTIDQYELLKELGTGGFGSVYLARDTAERRFVAVKGLPREMRDSAEELERIRRNFELIVQLKHDNIVALRHLHQANKVAFNDLEAAKKLNVERGQTLLVMDYAEGVPLSRWAMQFPEGKVPVEKAIEVTRQIATALDYAHSHKIIHRDVKPQNVVMQTREDGSFVAQVLDFGLAAEVRSSMNRSSAGNRGKSGTRHYMPPEQWHGKEQKASADQYSLAVLFYELVLGKVPFQSAFDSGDPIVAMTAVTTQPPEIPENLPKSVRRALSVALAKNGDDRFASCADFVAALEGKGGTRSVASAGKGGTRSRASALVGLAAALALAAGGAWWWQGRDGNGTNGTAGTSGTPPVAASTNAVSSVPEVSAVPDVPVRPSAPPVDEEAERRRLELKAETAVYALSVEMESASRLIAGEPEEVSAFFAPEIRAFEKMRQAGNDAKANRSYVTATNFFAQAKAKVDALKKLVTARANCLAAKGRAESEKRSADAVDAKSALALRYEEAEKALGQVASLVEKRDFAVASARAEAARSQFAALRTDVVKVALGEASGHKAAERWQECLAIAEKVLGWEPQNAAAAALKSEAESHLQFLRIVAKIGDREVPATVENNLFGKDPFHFQFGEDPFDQFVQMKRGMEQPPKKEVKRKDVLPVNLRISFDVKVSSQNSRGQTDLIGRKIERRAANGETNITCWIERNKDNMHRSFGFSSSGSTFCFPRDDLKVEYVENGKRYQGVLKSNGICLGTRKDKTVDSAWTGLKTITVCLTECVNKGPKPGDTKTITLPGGATMEMVWCPPGSFMMGSPESEEKRGGAEEIHEVTLTQGFWMGKYEVTQRQWDAVMGANQSFFKGADRPVEKVSWNDCQEFIRKINAAGQVTVALPTEAQWEYACRAGTTTPFSFGSTLNGDKANCDGNHPYGTSVKGRYREETADVGSYAPNAWGLYDMHGNVEEWCADWWGGYGGASTDPQGPTSYTSRVSRGGGWGSNAQFCRSASRNCHAPDFCGSFALGLRLVCSAGPRR